MDKTTSLNSFTTRYKKINEELKHKQEQFQSGISKLKSTYNELISEFKDGKCDDFEVSTDSNQLLLQITEKINESNSLFSIKLLPNADVAISAIYAEQKFNYEQTISVNQLHEENESCIWFFNFLDKYLDTKDPSKQAFLLNGQD